ncbi:MAG: malate dehydrogenase [Pseudomonadota bacterium]
MKKIVIMGAGAIGGVLAQHLALVKNIQIFLYDIAPGRAHGKVLDVGHAIAASKSTYMAPMAGSEDIAQIKDADIIVVTAGMARSAHMTRNDLLQMNLDIFRDIGPVISAYAPRSTIVVVTNPVDTMTWFLQKITGFPKERVMGMAGNLDEARFCYFLAKRLGVSFSAVDARVMGTHNDTMIPLPNYTTINGQPLCECMNEFDIASAVQETRSAGVTITALYQHQSPYFGPASSIYNMLLPMIQNQKTRTTVSAPYKNEDIYIGQSCVIDQTGIVQIETLVLSKTEEQTLQQSIDQLQALHQAVSPTQLLNYKK